MRFFVSDSGYLRSWARRRAPARARWLGVLLGGWMTAVCLTPAARGQGTPAAVVLLAEDFASLPVGAALPPGWWCEGSPTVAVKDGWLVQDANPDAPGQTHPNSVVWIGTEFAGDIRIGLKTWNTELRWDNVCITRISP